MSISRKLFTPQADSPASTISRSSQGSTNLHGPLTAAPPQPEDFLALFQRLGCHNLPQNVAIRWAFVDSSVSWILAFIYHYVQQSFPIDHTEDQAQDVGGPKDLDQKLREMEGDGVSFKELPNLDTQASLLNDSEDEFAAQGEIEQSLLTLEAYIQNLHKIQCQTRSDWASLPEIPDFSLPETSKLTVPEIGRLESAMLGVCPDPINALCEFFVEEKLAQLQEDLELHLQRCKLAYAKELLINLVTARGLSILQTTIPEAEQALDGTDILATKPNGDTSSSGEDLTGRETSTWIPKSDKVAQELLAAVQAVESADSRSTRTSQRLQRTLSQQNDALRSSYTPFSTIASSISSLRDPFPTQLPLGVEAMDFARRKAISVAGRFDKHDPGKVWVDRIKRETESRGKRTFKEIAESHQKLKRLKH